jgi:hypothetical protein
MNCETCADKRKQAEPVAYIVHEADMARMERTVKRLWIVLILCILFLVGSNAAWIWYESQFETVETWQDVWQEADGNGNNQFIGGDYNGWPTSEDADENQNP